MLRAVRESLLKTGWSLGLYTPPDRRVLRTLLERYAADAAVTRVLFVGVKAYNVGLAALFAPRTFATIDPTPEVAPFGGAPHFVDVVQHLDKHVAAASFDLVVMNGVIGFGLDTHDGVEEALRQVHRALSEGGTLLLGINVEIPKHVDLATVEAMKLYRPKPLPGFASPRHVVATPFRERSHTFEAWGKA